LSFIIFIHPLAEAKASEISNLLYVGNEENSFRKKCSSTLRPFWGNNMEAI
jgi:hypothetical protein